jgi:tripartite-type tricarboxylate transporter receptor subunit TctC
MKTAVRCIAVAATLCASAVALAQAPAYPTRPVTIILPLQAGSASDIATRVVAERLSESLKQSFLVENAPGGAGLIGAERVARAKPDGYTLAAMNNSILTILPHIKKAQVKFDATRDFVPIMGLAVIPTFLGVAKDLPVNNVKELVALAKQKPGELNYSSGGSGSPQHLATEMFMAMSGVKLTHVPYKGATAAAADLASGQVQVMFIAHSLALPFLPAQRLRLIAYAGPQRSAALPEIPTVAEAGYPDFDYSSWIALFAPTGTPDDIVKLLRDETARILADPAIKERFAKSGLEIWPVPADRLTATLNQDLARWEKVVRTANITAD